MYNLLAVGFREYLGVDFEQLVPKNMGGICIHEALDLDQALPLFNTGDGFRLVIVCIDSNDLFALANVQQLRDLCKDAIVMALFDVDSSMIHSDSVVARVLTTLWSIHASFAVEKDGTAIDQPVLEPSEKYKFDERRVSASDQVFLNLTPRQLEVLKLVAEGQSNKMIARRLGLSEGTVKVHCMAIFRAFGVTNRTQAAMVAERTKLLENKAISA